MKKVISIITIMAMLFCTTAMIILFCTTACGNSGKPDLSDVEGAYICYEVSASPASLKNSLENQYIGMKATVNGNELKFDEKTYTLVDRETEESGYSWLFIKGTGKTRDGTDSSYKDYEGLGFVGYAPVGCFTSPPNSKKVIKLHFTYEGDISNAYILYCEKM